MALRRKTEAGEFIGTCVNLPRRQLEEYDASERSIGYRRFASLAGPALVAQLNAGRVPRLSQDFCVTYGRDKWRGKDCICMHDSAIHHLWYLDAN